MTGNESFPTFTPRVAYKDQRAAIAWLTRAFGFKNTILVTINNEHVVHAEMKFGNGRIFVGSEWENIHSPLATAGTNTQTVSVELEEGLDSHCEHARAAGAKIIQEPTDQFYGERTYRVIDPEGHMWIFSQKTRDASAEEIEKAVPGMKVTQF